MSSHKFDRRDQNDHRALWLILLILSLLLLIGGVVGLILLKTGPVNSDPDPKQMIKDPPVSSPSEPSRPGQPGESESETAEGIEGTTKPELPDNPADFAGYWEINPDVIGCIYIPMNREGDDFDYDIRLPILQARLADDDNFYLHHNLNREYQFSGELYTQKKNAKDFSDRVTVVYGHNMLNPKARDTRFTNLLDFRSKAFFESHDVFYIYTPGHILTYTIVTATAFDTRHILNNFDFKDDSVYEEWINNYVLNPRSMGAHAREGTEVTVDDKIVILSTCMDRGARRYLVEGVLINDEPTK